MLADLPLSELRRYTPDVAEPADFDEFWAGQLGAAREHSAEPSFQAMESPARHGAVYDVTFAGYAGDPIRAWLLDPYQTAPDAAIVVEYVGYGGGRGHPLDWLKWTCAGHPHLVMDTRGQGGGWRSADTSDPGDTGAPSAAGFLTRGIMDPRSYYYTRLFVDAARAVDAVRGWPGGAGRPIVTAGASQGGGLAIAAAHLVGGIAATLPDVPFLAHPQRALDVTDTSPYRELAEYCKVRPDRGPGLRHPRLPRRGQPRQARQLGRPVLRGPGRHHHPAVHHLRRLQLLRRAQGHRRLPLQRARGRRDAALSRAARLPAPGRPEPALSRPEPV